MTGRYCEARRFPFSPAGRCRSMMSSVVDTTSEKIRSSKAPWRHSHGHAPRRSSPPRRPDRSAPRRPRATNRAHKNLGRRPNKILAAYFAADT